MSDAADSGEGLTEDEMREIATVCFELARTGDAERLPLYVDHGLPVNLTDGDGNTILMLAAYHGHVDLVRALVERGADVDRLNDRGQSPLAGAFFKGEDEVAQVLIEAGADLDNGTPSARDAAVIFGRTDLLP
ncbi:MAG: ankyrin repeat domain-containing protein [Micrococcales bacterium]|nr:ankyrin repeat domain-containing protein [Micrococcales bacterium]